MQRRYLCTAALFDSVSYVAVIIEVRDTSFCNWIAKLNERSYVYGGNILKIHIHMEVIDPGYDNDNNTILIYLYEAKTTRVHFYFFLVSRPRNENVYRS